MRFGPSHSTQKPTVYRDHRIARPQNPVFAGDVVEQKTMTFNVTAETMTFNVTAETMEFN